MVKSFFLAMDLWVSKIDSTIDWRSKLDVASDQDWSRIENRSRGSSNGILRLKQILQLILRNASQKIVYYPTTYTTMSTYPKERSRSPTSTMARNVCWRT